MDVRTVVGRASFLGLANCGLRRVQRRRQRYHSTNTRHKTASSPKNSTEAQGPLKDDPGSD